MAYYDTNTQDTPLRDISGVKAYSEFQYYKVLDENDPDMIFIQGINPDEQGLPKNIEILKDDGIREKHVRGSPVEVMAALNELDNNR
ncbi:MAG: hypothetical protein WBX01_09790 [Nitrososphaeraceae archaeon]|jgi:hypothetical protein